MEFAGAEFSAGTAFAGSEFPAGMEFAGAEFPAGVEFAGSVKTTGTRFCLCGKPAPSQDLMSGGGVLAGFFSPAAGFFRHMFGILFLRFS